ncbi:MAG TPA: RNA-binding domain-containing protein [Bryobacteraceae bacterium]|nr:RNA-binding domain-containing protein [Bryobacteraceae bacterium]
MEGITATVSAFANQNRQGGLLVIGVARTGEAIGTTNLSEQPDVVP